MWAPAWRSASAEMRMANEADKLPKAQGRRTDLNFPQGAGEVSPTLKELGIDDRRPSEWREMRDASEGVESAR